MESKKTQNHHHPSPRDMGGEKEHQDRYFQGNYQNFTTSSDTFLMAAPDITRRWHLILQKLSEG